MELKDSGNRREFESGAVRDMAEGKGRCDLLPLDILSEFEAPDNEKWYILNTLNEYKLTGNIGNVYKAYDKFVDNNWDNPYNMYLDLAKHFEDGAKKYGDNNWMKGIPTQVYLDSALRHLFKYYAGWTDEPHDRAFVWNLVCLIWTAEHKPELNSYADSNSSH